MLALPNWFRCKARCAARGAAICVIAIVAALTVDARGTAAAQGGRLQAKYVATISGIKVAEGNWSVEISNRRYDAAAIGATAGWLKYLIGIGAHGTGDARGIIARGKPVPTSYAETIIDHSHVDAVRMALAGGNVTAYSVLPPPKRTPGRIPVTAADRRGVVDPMTSALTDVAGSGNPVTPVACRRKASVFDGRVRYDLQSEFKRMEFVKADKGYAGPAVVCALHFKPISGYVPNHSGIKFLIQLRNAEVWLAPIAGTRMLVPFRFSMSTPLGPGVLEAKQFLSVAAPSRAAARTQ